MSTWQSVLFLRTEENFANSFLEFLFNSALLVANKIPLSNVTLTAFNPLLSVTSSTLAFFTFSAVSAATLSMCRPIKAPAPEPTAPPMAAPTAVFPAILPMIPPINVPPPAPIKAPVPVLVEQLKTTAKLIKRAANFIFFIILIFKNFYLFFFITLQR